MKASFGPSVWTGATDYHSPEKVPPLRPVGAWGWAAHMQRLDLIVTTAALLGFQGGKIDLIPDGYYGPTIGSPWWYPAYDFLRERNLVVTETLNVEPIVP